VLEEDGPAGAKMFRARESLRRAERAMQRLDYGDAINEAQTALSQALTARPDRAAVAVLVDAAVVEGVASFLLGKPEAAERAFRLATTLDPERTLDPIIYRSDIRASFARAQGQLRKSGAGKLVVRSDPQRALVLLDGRPVGHTGSDGTLTVERVPGGEHVVAVTAPGYWAHVTRARIEPTIPAEIDTILAPSDKPEHARDLVTVLRSTVAHAAPGGGASTTAALARDDAERARRDLAKLLEVEALVLVTATRGTPGGTDHAVIIVVQGGPDGALSAERVLEVGGQSSARTADAIHALLAPLLAPTMPPPSAAPALTATEAAPPPAPSRPPPPRRRWWLWAVVGGALAAAGTTAGVVLMSDVRYVGVVSPQRGPAR